MPEDLLIRHPSERRPPAPREVTLCVGCCSLYTIGALVGAYLGGGLRRPPDAPPFDPGHRIPLVRRLFVGLPNNQWYFWSSWAGVFLVAALVQPVVIRHTLSGLRDWREAFVVGILWLVLGAPAYGLVAWLVASLWMSLRPAGSVTTAEWNHHYRALLWAFLGTLLGLIAMVLLSRAGYELARSPGRREVSPAVAQHVNPEEAARLACWNRERVLPQRRVLPRQDERLESSRENSGRHTRGGHRAAGQMKEPA